MNWLQRLFARESAPRPTPIAVTLTEGGEWLKFPLYPRRPPTRDGWSVHSIAFSDGSIWDAVNGWRPGDHSHTMEFIERTLY